MEKKFKDDYQKQIIISNRIYKFSARYLYVWLCLFILYFTLAYYTNFFVEDLVLNGKPLPLMSLLVYSFVIGWIFPFSYVYFKDIDIFKVKTRLCNNIGIQKEKVSRYKDQFTEEGLKSKRVQRKLTKMENKLTKLKTELDMMGFMDTPEDI